MFHNLKHPIFAQVCIFLILFGVNLQPINDADFGWHLRTGMYIWENRTLPTTDFLSYSAPDYPYINYSYLADIIIAASYSIAGLWGVSLMYTSVYALGLLLLSKTSTSGIKQTIFTLIILSPIFQSVIGFRPQLFSFVGIILLLIWQQQYVSKVSKRDFVLIPLLFLLWSQLHPGFVMGLLLLISLSLIKKSVPLAAISISTALITLINPYGLELHRFIWSMSQNSLAYLVNTDWIPYFANPLFHPVHKWLLTSITLGIILFSGRQVFWRGMTLFLLCLALGVSSRYLLATAALTLYLSLGLPELKLNKLFSTRYKINTTFLWIIVGLSLLQLISQNVFRTITGNANPYESIANSQDFRVYPHQAIQIIKTQGKASSKILNDYNWGGYISWQLPEAKVFIDGRMDNFYVDNLSFLATYNTIVKTEQGWEDLLSKYWPDYVLLSPQYPIIQALKERNWEVIYENEYSVLMQVPGIKELNVE